MDISEKQLEDFIFFNDNEFLNSNGMDISGKKFRQVKLWGYGIADIITYFRFEDNFLINVFELKKGKISINTLNQSLKYLAAINKRFNLKFPSENPFESKSVKLKLSLTMVGDSVSNNDNIRYVSHFSNNLIRIYTYEVEEGNISFHLQDDFVKPGCLF